MFKLFEVIISEYFTNFYFKVKYIHSDICIGINLFKKIDQSVNFINVLIKI